MITEDLGRICRRIHAIAICEAAIDHGVRLIAINDRLDTSDEHWMLNAFFAAMHHQLSNRDTSRRIRRTSRGRFETNGGMLACLIYGYIKADGAKTDDELLKDPAATPVYDEWFRRLEDGATYAEVADRLNANGISTGPYHRSPRWTGTMVRAVTLNPILKGVRYRNKRVSKRNRSGRRKSVKAPPEMLLERECPHLAHIEPER
ncbi:MAG: recombinase family protein [Planctomycetota bacterium]|nr:recombinase family protein [Planctomycetota bacterium]